MEEEIVVVMEVGKMVGRGRQRAQMGSILGVGVGWRRGTLKNQTAGLIDVPALFASANPFLLARHNRKYLESNRASLRSQIKP